MLSVRARVRHFPGQRGICGVRENRNGQLYSLVYGLLIAQNVDPIEKKPLFHVYPGSLSYSIATVGCNFQCSFCQNADISQMVADHGRISGREVSSQTVVESARNAKCKSIAYTYTEPTIFFEYALDTARLAANEDIINIFVSNGYMSMECLDQMAPYLAAANVDLKSFQDAYYKEQCKARLQPVLDSLKKMKDLGVWLEITTLLIPGLNDSEEELRDIARFIRDWGRKHRGTSADFIPPTVSAMFRRRPPNESARLGKSGSPKGCVSSIRAICGGMRGKRPFAPAAAR